VIGTVAVARVFAAADRLGTLRAACERVHDLPGDLILLPPAAVDDNRAPAMSQIALSLR